MTDQLRERIAARIARFGTEALANAGLRAISVRHDSQVALEAADDVLALVSREPVNG